MTLWDFLVLIFDMYGIAINVDPWFFTVPFKIEFVPHAVVDGILREAGFRVEQGQYFCGLTEMVGGHLKPGYLFPYTVDRVLVVEPSPQCPIETLRFNVDHELRHVSTWILEHMTKWEGHP